MGLKETIKTMHSLIDKIVHDLKKSERGNKAASQRVRTASIKLAKVAKTYRKESVSEEKKCKKAKKIQKAKKSTKAKKVTKAKKSKSKKRRR